jgi:hypothetical protein
MIKSTPQSAVKAYLLIEHIFSNHLARNFDKEMRQNVIHHLDHLYHNSYAKSYKNENLYQKALNNICKKQFMIEDLVKYVANSYSESSLEQMKDVLKATPKEFYDIEHALIAVSSKHIDWLEEFEKAGYNLHAARGSIVIPIWCLLLKEPDEFEQVMTQFRFKPKNWTKNLMESAISFGNVKSLQYLFEKNMYEPSMANYYLNLYNSRDVEMNEAIQRLNSLYEKQKLETMVESQPKSLTKMKL